MTVFAGQLARASDVPAPTWTDFTPSITNLTVGNGTLDGRYMRLPGDLIVVQYRFVAGSTSNVTGNIALQLPVDVDNSTDYGMPVGDATARSGAVTGLNIFKGLVVYAGVPSEVNILSQNGASGDLWDASSPSTTWFDDPNGMMNAHALYPGVAA